MHDIFIIGGGINGCGIARDAAGRGHSVFLAEMNDLANGTSSGSTKLIHGGLRYLEHYEFRLVREALMERERLWHSAPHIIWPLRLILPHHKGLRPAWLLRLGLFLYDHIGGRKLLPTTRSIDLRSDPAGRALKPGFERAFEFSDCWVDDARLVVLNARDAADKGAEIRTRTKAVAARREGDHWVVEIEDLMTGAREEIQARMLINAAGPWIDRVLGQTIGRNDAHNVRLVKGSHVVIRRKFEDPRSFFFQNSDGRIFFAIPYEDDFTLIGTTDEDFPGDPANAAISDSEIDYLCASASEYFAEPVRREDIVWTYAGVRPLFDDGADAAQEATRDYVLKVEKKSGAPLMNIFGGKITTYRRLAEAALEKIEKQIGAKGKPWTAKSVLPGGDFGVDEVEARIEALCTQFPFLARTHARRLIRLYGTRARTLLGDARSVRDLGRHFGADLYAAEVDYLMRLEWAQEAQDILWRRTKLGLRLDAKQAAALDAYVSEAMAASDAPAGSGKDRA
ncbi:MAG: glycerol-3-phosphate dehydrogenase [Mesorhizobium sp.]|nr:glycerol-3-phosphate dehydrogenase [Mesorhizobium sp.]